MDRPTGRGDAVGMSAIVGRLRQRVLGGHRTGRTPAALFWRLFLLNALVFVAGAGVLLLSPATVRGRRGLVVGRVFTGVRYAGSVRP
jgi:two-component system, NarL family, sensor histidine kinase UhpB